MKSLLSALSFIFVFAVSPQAIARPIKGTPPVISETPQLQNRTYNFGAPTVANEGGVDIEYLLATNSAPAKTWTIRQTTTGSTPNGYWSYGTSGSTVNDLTALATPTVVLSSPGTGYAVNDTILLSNGAQVNVTVISNGSQIFSVSPISNPTNPTATFAASSGLSQSGAGLVTQVSTSGSGSGATFSYTYATHAQTPQPSSTGAIHNLDNDATVMDAVEFQVSATGYDNSVSNTVTVKINLIADSWSVSVNPDYPASSTYASTSIFGFGNGTTRTNTLQAAVNGCANCSGSTGDMKLLISSGAKFTNPNTGPNHDTSYQFGLGGSTGLNIGAAIANATWSGAAGPNNKLTVEDACRALTFTCDGSVGLPTTFETVSASSTDPTCLLTAGTTIGFTYVNFVGLTFGGAPLYNNRSTTPIGMSFADTCHAGAAYTYAYYPAQIAGGEMISDLGGNVFSLMGTASNSYNQYLELDWTTCIYAPMCWEDGTTTQTYPSSINISHMWVRGYNQNAITPASETLTWNDVYTVAPYVYPSSGSHVDNVQFDDGNSAKQPVNDVLKRTWMLQAEGDSQTQGWFMGNFNGSNGGSPKGLKMLGGVFAGHSETLLKSQNCDGTSASCDFTHWTAVQQNPPVPGINGAGGYTLLTFVGTIPDGLTLTVGVGCNGGGAQSCSQATNSVQFCYQPITANCTVSNYWRIAIPNNASTTPAQAMLALYNALGYSSGNNYCDKPTALGLALNLCVGGLNFNPGVAYSVDVFSTIDPQTDSGDLVQSIASNNSAMSFFGTGSLSSNLLTLGFIDLPYNPPSGPSLLMDHAYPGTTVGATCGTVVQWCGTALNLDGVYVQDSASITSLTATYFACTPAALQSQLGTTYFTITPNNIFGQDSTSSGCVALTSKSFFSADATLGPRAAETNLEQSFSWQQWIAMSPYQVCEAYVARLTPAVGGWLTPAGNTALSEVVGLIGTDGVSLTDGSGLTPCYDLGVGSAYQINPYPH
jgi:hypothetical protein